MTKRAPTAEEIRAKCREMFFEMLDRPDLHGLLRQAVADPQRARRQCPHLLAGIRRYRPDLLPAADTRKTPAATPAARAGRSRTKR